MERVTDYEKGNQTCSLEEIAEQDLFEGELALFFVVKKQGLVILGETCAHAVL